MNQEDYLRTKFPDLQVGRKPGSLGATNGFGTTLTGRRDFDPETGTYVATHVVTILFIPLIPIGAYRVADAQQGGWYCIGRVPMSMAARGWNVLLVLAVLGTIGGIWWNSHTGTPEYAAGQKLKEADRAAAAGQGGQAAKLCREVMDSKTEHAEAGKTKLGGLIENPPGPPTEAAAVYAVAVDLHRDNRCPGGNPFDRGRALAQKHADGDPAAALALLEVIGTYAPNPEAELDLRRDLLEKLLARDPNDVDAVSRLAVVCEAKGDRKRCESLLAPVADKLGVRDGAAILGRIHASRGELDRANALLRPFVETRLAALRAAEEQFRAAGKAAEERVRAQLESQKAPGFDYAAYERGTKAQQGALMNNYFETQLKNDAGIRAARQQLMAHGSVVGAALDLGLVQLQRGQAMGDAAARKAELETAERTFLSVRGFAGEDDHYRISLGQVYYWLGRPADGKKQFDDLLAARNRSSDALSNVANALREVGDTSGARAMVEDAYSRESDAVKKQQVASVRSLMRLDFDDEILWLTRSNTEDLATQASLAAAPGNKANQDGDDKAAEAHFRRAIELYAKQTDSIGTFNNSALAHFALFHVTGDKEEFARGTDKLDRAIALLPSDSILLSNATSNVLEGALRDAGTGLDFRVLKRGAGWDSLGFLYRGPAERGAVMARVAAHSGTVKARAYAEKLMTLAPKRVNGYGVLSALYYYTRNVDGLKAVLARAAAADLDLGDQVRDNQEFLSGSADAKKGDEARKSLARTETVLTAAKSGKGPTFAAAVAQYVRAKQTVWYYGDSADPDEFVKLSDEVLAVAPSDGAEGTLASSLAFRAHAALAKDNPEYARLATKTKRVLGPSLVYFVLSSDGPLKAAAVANADVRRLAAMGLDSFARDPDGTGPATWALVRAVNPERADAVRTRVKTNERMRLHDQLTRRLSPTTGTNVMDEYWWLLLDGKDAEAKKLLADAAAKGLPVP